MLLTRQQDKPGIVAGVTTQLAKDEVNISFMTVGRSGKGQVREAALSLLFHCRGVDHRRSDVREHAAVASGA